MGMIACQNIRAPMEIDLIENWSDRGQNWQSTRESHSCMPKVI